MLDSAIAGNRLLIGSRVEEPDVERLVLLQFADRVVQPFVPAADLDFIAAVNVENVGFFCCFSARVFSSSILIASFCHSDCIIYC